MSENVLTKKKIDPSENKQSFLNIPITIHCCRYWMFQEWEFTNMAFPFWRRKLMLSVFYLHCL